MSKVIVIDRSGVEEALDIRPDLTLMQTITDAGISDLLALCGGVCSCATCHVFAHGGADPRTFTAAHPGAEREADEVLSIVHGRDYTSPLGACRARTARLNSVLPTRPTREPARCCASSP